MRVRGLAGCRVRRRQHPPRAADVRDLVSPFGFVARVELPTNQLGVAFVHFVYRTSAQNCIAELHGKPVRHMRARARRQRTPPPSALLEPALT